MKMCPTCFEEFEKLVTYHKQKMCEDCKDQVVADELSATLSDGVSEEDLEDLRMGDIWERTDFPVTRFEILKRVEDDFWSVKKFKWDFDTKRWSEHTKGLILSTTRTGTIIEAIKGDFIRRHYKRLDVTDLMRPGVESK